MRQRPSAAALLKIATGAPSKTPSSERLRGPGTSPEHRGLRVTSTAAAFPTGQEDLLPWGAWQNAKLLNNKSQFRQDISTWYKEKKHSGK